MSNNNMGFILKTPSLAILPPKSTSKIFPRNQALDSNAQISRACLMDLLQLTEPCLSQIKELKFAATEQKVSHNLGIYTKIEVSSGFS